MTERNKFEDIRQAFENAGYETRSYSGRAMFGERCLGVVCNNPVKAALKATNELAAEYRNLAWDDVGATEESEMLATALDMLKEATREMYDSRTDSLGLSTILYFPDIPFVGSEE